MSIKIMSQVWESETLDTYERIVLLSLADHADDEGRCYPSISRLCKRTGLATRGIQGVIRRLESAGYLTVEMNAGRNGANLYTVHPTPAPGAPRTERTPAPDAPPPPHPITQTPAPGAPKPSKNHHKTVNKGHSFSEFWKIWPNKTAKAAAEKAWKKLNADDRAMAFEKTQPWFSAWRRQNPQASPIHPATYLNQRRWEDQFEQQQKSAGDEMDRWRKMSGRK